MELWKYYRILRKRKWLIIIGTLICVSIVIAATFLSKQKWEAYSIVTEKSPSEDNVSIYSGPYAYQMDPRLRMSNLIQWVKSQTVLERAADTMLRDGVSQTPEKILSVLSTLKVTPVMDSTLLMIAVRSDVEKEAIDAANIVTEEFKNRYSDLNYGSVAKSKEFIEQELPKAEKRLNTIREGMRKFKEESGMVMLPQQTNALIQEMSQLQQMAAQYEVKAQQSGARLKSLEQELKTYPETRTASTVISSNPVWQSLQVELAKQEIELQKSLKERTQEHPDVQALNKQIAETRKKLEEAGKDILSSKTEAANPVSDVVAQSYVESLVEYSSSSAASAAAKQIIDTLKSDMKSLPEKEMRLAQLTLDEEAAQSTYSLLRQKLDEATIKEQEAGNLSSIEIVDRAKSRPADPMSRKIMRIILAFILSPLFCCGIAFLLNYLDNTIKTPAEAEELLKLPVIATVPLAGIHSLADSRHHPAFANMYQMLSTNILVGDTGLQGKAILLASAEPDVGRSNNAANLAISLARDGACVILVDSDLRQPSLHTIFGIDNEKGLSNILAGQLKLEDAPQKTIIPISPTRIDDLLLIPSGPLPANPVKLLRSEAMAKFIDEVSKLADFVIFDSPAGIAFPDASILATHVKNVITVYAAGTVPRGAESEFRTRLEHINANVLGVILNMVKPEDSHGYYHFKSAYEGLMRSAKGSADLNG